MKNKIKNKKIKFTLLSFLTFSISTLTIIPSITSCSSNYFPRLISSPKEFLQFQNKIRSDLFLKMQSFILPTEAEIIKSLPTDITLIEGSINIKSSELVFETPIHTSEYVTLVQSNKRYLINYTESAFRKFLIEYKYNDAAGTETIREDWFTFEKSRSSFIKEEFFYDHK